MLRADYTEHESDIHPNRSERKVKLSRRTLRLLLVMLVSAPLFAKAWYVRPEGGTRYSSKVTSGQCDGRTDAPYSGKGVNQHCVRSCKAPGLFSMEDRSIKWTASHNIEYGNRSGTGSSCRGDIICSDPPLLNQPPQQDWTNLSFLDNFNFHPASGSPAHGCGITVNGITTDYYSSARPNPAFDWRCRIRSLGHGKRPDAVLN
jgi:hypothetical protein